MRAWVAFALGLGLLTYGTAARAEYLISPVATPDDLSRVTGINNAGAVAGFTSDGSVFVTGPSGTIVPIDPPAHGAIGGWAGINNLNQVVGSYRTPETINNVFISISGFIETNGSFTRLNVPGANATYPTSINDRGEVAGYYFVPSLYHGFTYANGVYTTVDAGPSVTDLGTRIFGINNQGDLVGTFEGPTGIQGFLVQGGVTTRFDVPGFESVRPDIAGTRAFDINELGQIVGWAQHVDLSSFDTDLRGFIATGGLFDLVDFAVFGINDRGQLLGRNFIATPVPEPAGLGALAIGFVALAALRIRRAQVLMAA